MCSAVGTATYDSVLRHSAPRASVSRILRRSSASHSYNQNTVERRALLSSTAVGGTVFIAVAGCLAPRFAKMKPALRALQESFRAVGTGRRAPDVPVCEDGFC